VIVVGVSEVGVDLSFEGGDLRGDVVWRGLGLYVFGCVCVVTWPGLWMLAHARMVRASWAFAREEAAFYGPLRSRPFTLLNEIFKCG
jgi:hypothetical protein